MCKFAKPSKLEHFSVSPVIKGYCILFCTCNYAHVLASESPMVFEDCSCMCISFCIYYIFEVVCLAKYMIGTGFPSMLKWGWQGHPHFLCITVMSLYFQLACVHELCDFFLWHAEILSFIFNWCLSNLLFY